MLLAPAKPGIGTGKGAVDQIDALLLVKCMEHQAHVLPDGTGDTRLEGELTLAAIEQQTYLFPGFSSRPCCTCRPTPPSE